MGTQVGRDCARFSMRDGGELGLGLRPPDMP